MLLPGVLEDGRLAKQTAGSFRRVAAGKVAGLQALERQLSNAPTSGVVAFSSVSSIVAPLGQPNYASANASLCAWASAKAAQGDICSQMPRTLCSRLTEPVYRCEQQKCISKTCQCRLGGSQHAVGRLGGQRHGHHPQPAAPHHQVGCTPALGSTAPPFFTAAVILQSMSASAIISVLRHVRQLC